MKDFIINLYANKYFPIYLGVVIVVLLIAFFIVFFLGKKDQKKIEETQKLNLEKLKEAQGNSNVINNEVKPITENVQMQNVDNKVEVQPITQMANSNVNSASEIKPVINEIEEHQGVKNNITEPVKPMPSVETQVQMPTPKVETPIIQTNLQPVEPIIKPKPIQVVDTPKVTPSVNVQPTIQPVKPVDDDVYRVNKKEEETVNRLKELSTSLDKEMSTFNTKPLVNEQINEVKPVINEEKPKVMNVYSSVYVPNNNVSTPEKVETPVINNVEEDLEDTMEIELPKLKAEEPVLKDNSSDPLNLL